MFERVEIAEPSHKTATAVAFLINSSVILLAIAIPLMKPDQMAMAFRSVGAPVFAPRRIVTEAQPRPAAGHRVISLLTSGKLSFPGKIPPKIDSTPDEATDTDVAGPIGPIGNEIGANANTLFTSTNPPPLPTVKPAPKPTVVNISKLDPGFLVRQVQPVYPIPAKIIRVQGPVVLSALIDTHGEVVGIRALSGHPLLVQAAIAAVKQWRYRPYILNGSPVEVQTEVTVNFVLQ